MNIQQEQKQKMYLRGLINATLSSRVYLDSIKNLKEDLLNNPYASNFEFNQEDIDNNGENYYLAKKLNAQLSKFFKPLSSNELNYDINLHNYDDGIYKINYNEDIDKNNESRFSMGLFISEIEQENTLHLVFRGTEPNYNNKLLYFGYDYVSMERHYKAFELLIEKALDYAEKNNIKHIDVAGHSLGGAMVDLFLRENENKKNKFNINGYAFGNPYGYSSDSSVRNIDWCIDKLEKSKISKYKCFQILGSSAISVSALTMLKKLVINCFDNMLFIVTNTIKKFIFNDINEIDNKTEYVSCNNNNKLTSFNHKSDPVVIVGALAYETSGNRILLSDDNISPRNKIKSMNPFENINNIINVFKNIGTVLIENHSMNNYMAAFINRTNDYIDEKTNSDFLKNVIEIKNNFENHKEKIKKQNNSINLSKLLNKLRENINPLDLCIKNQKSF